MEKSCKTDQKCPVLVPDQLEEGVVEDVAPLNQHVRLQLFPLLLGSPRYSHS